MTGAEQANSILSILDNALDVKVFASQHGVFISRQKRSFYSLTFLEIISFLNKFS